MKKDLNLFSAKMLLAFFWWTFFKIALRFHLPLEEEENGVEVSSTEVRLETALALLNNQACMAF
jgi:hypothetical protein